MNPFERDTPQRQYRMDSIDSPVTSWVSEEDYGNIKAENDYLWRKNSELQRRLDKIVAEVLEDAGPEPTDYTYPEDPRLLRWQTVMAIHERIKAIAGGKP